MTRREFEEPRTMRRHGRMALAAVLALALAPASARADGGDAPVYAVQNRLYTPKHEFALGLGTVPLNAFTKGVTLGLGYTHHFSDMWAWEIAQFTYSFGVDTALKQQLLDNFQVEPTKITRLNYFGSSSLVWKPLYGKLALGNRYVVHLEAFFDLGVAVGVFSNASQTASAAFSSPSAVLVGFDAGGGLRFFASDLVSIRFDIRDYTFFKAGGTNDELYLGLAVAFSFGGGAR